MLEPASVCSYSFSVHARRDGTLEAAYVKWSAGEAVRTVEIEPSKLLADYDEHDQLVGIEILAPVTLAELLPVVDRWDAPRRQQFRNFLESFASPAVLTA